MIKGKFQNSITFKEAKFAGRVLKQMKRLFLFFSIIILILPILVLISSGCANIIPPMGGPRDSLPPALINVKPADSTKKFTDNRIVFSFDEYVEIQDVQKNLIVSPVPKVTPNVERRLNTIVVKLRDTLEPNTTFTLDFGNSIKDLNEGNVLKNFMYVFSTGTYFDSLQLRGRVILAKDASVDTTLTVMLHRNTFDSAIVKEKPRYVTKVDNNGNFRFHNLPPGTYALYAMKDEGGTYRFSGREQLFAFADKPVETGDTTFFTLYAFPDNEGAATAAPLKKQQPSKDKRLILRDNLDNKQQDLLKNFVLSVETPFKTFDTTKIVFASDSTFEPVTDYSLTKDSTGKVITLKHSWKEGTLYHLILDKEFGADTLGNKLLKSDTISFTTKKASDYGSVRLRLLNLDMSKNPVLLFVQNNNVVDSAVLTTPDFFKQVFVPGEYQLRILWDGNKNGKWDAGEFFIKHRQPELIKPIAQKIVIKANWENDFERDVKAAAVPENRAPQKQSGPSGSPANNRRN
jgi:hypothetical protein